MDDVQHTSTDAHDDYPAESMDDVQHTGRAFIAPPPTGPKNFNQKGNGKGRAKPSTVAPALASSKAVFARIRGPHLPPVVIGRRRSLTASTELLASMTSVR